MKKIFTIFFAIMFSIANLIPVLAEESAEVLDNVNIVSNPDSQESLITYSSVEETEDGKFIFSLAETLNITRSNERILCKQIAVVTPFSETYHDSLSHDIEEMSIVRRMSRATLTYADQKVDNSQSFTIFMTVTINITTAADGMSQTAKIVSVNGGYTSMGGNYVGSGVYVRSQTVDVSNRGGRYGGGLINDEIRYNPYYSSCSWTYTTPSNWESVFYSNDSYHELSACYTVIAGRGSSGTSGWTTTLVVHQ